MKSIGKYLIYLNILLLMSHHGAGQASFASNIDNHSGPKNCAPPKNREIFHDYINNEQKNILRSDGKTDNLYTPSVNEDVNFLVTQSLLSKVDALQCKIEADSTLNHSAKVRYLRGIENMLKYYQANVRYKRIKPAFLPEIVSAYDFIRFVIQM